MAGGVTVTLAANAVLVPVALLNTNTDTQKTLLITDGIITGVCGLVGIVGIYKIAEGAKWFKVDNGKVVFYLRNPGKVYGMMKK